MLCAELMRAQWSLMCDLPLHPPHPFPPTSLPPFSPPLHSHHTPHGHVTNTLPNLAFVLLYITVWMYFPIAIVHFLLPLPQRSETHLAKTPFPAYHTYSVIKVTELSSHIEYECRWATDGFRQCVNHGKTRPKTIQKGLVHGTGIAICSDKDSFYLPFFTWT